jgi:hypothetical protein
MLDILSGRVNVALAIEPTGFLLYFDVGGRAFAFIEVIEDRTEGITTASGKESSAG